MKWTPVLLWMAACSGQAPSTVDDWSAPDTEGTFLAGAEPIELTGRSGVSLAGHVWFPAIRGDTDLVEYGDFLPGGAVQDGVPDCAQARPVVLFSHGNGGISFQSFFLTEHLARHGYVVVAPDHTGNTLTDNVEDRGALALRRPHDIADSFDWLVAESRDPDSSLFGCIDPEDGYGVTGHSFGGYTTLATAGARLDLDALTAQCASGSDFLCGAETAWAEAYPGDNTGDLSDHRVYAAVPLAPAGAIALMESTVEVPTLAIGGLEDGLTTWEDQLLPIYAGLQTEPRALAGMEATGHYTFTNLCTTGFDGCGDGAIDLVEAHGLIRTMTLAWMDVARGETRSGDWLPPESDALAWEQQGLP